MTANVDINPTLGQVFIINLQVTTATQTITLRCHDGTSAITPAAGSIVYLIINTTSSHTTAATVSGGTNIKMVSISVATTASRTLGVTLVSDGTNLVQVGANIAATPGMA